MKRFSVFVAIFFTALSSMSQPLRFEAGDYVHALKRSTDIMVNDVTSPIAASRYYAYITIAANEVFALTNPGHPKMPGLVRGMAKINLPAHTIRHCHPGFAAILTTYRVTARLLPSGYLMKRPIDSLIGLASSRLDSSAYQSSMTLVDSVVANLLRYAGPDGFAKLSGMRRYTPSSGDGFWQPTPPAFMPALEPYWNTLQTFVLDSAAQFKPQAPAAYSSDSGSAYFKLVSEVYHVTSTNDSSKNAIANFWDCNPFALQQMGHVEFGLKKISPGGHWMGITGIACLKAGKSMEESSYIHALTAVTIADAFICCWDEKYRSNRIRPETAIKRLIDPEWKPLLQTPPFPEYPSGHSVISSAAATVLTQLFGSRFSFTDDTETEFGLPARKFNSFWQAANEASISRLYGGIHYRDAIDNGIRQGRAVGNLALLRLIPRKATIQR